jgi:hypothetical protein
MPRPSPQLSYPSLKKEGSFYIFYHRQLRAISQILNFFLFHTAFTFTGYQTIPLPPVRRNFSEGGGEGRGGRRSL